MSVYNYAAADLPSILFCNRWAAPTCRRCKPTSYSSFVTDGQHPASTVRSDADTNTSQSWRVCSWGSDAHKLGSFGNRTVADAEDWFRGAALEPFFPCACRCDCNYVCVHVYVCVHIMCTCVCVCVCVCIFMCMCMCVCVCVFMCTCMCICMCECV